MKARIAMSITFPLTLFVLVPWIAGCTPTDGGSGNTQDSGMTNLSVLEDAFQNGTSGIQVQQEGDITAVLSDDTVGDRHQRMIVRMANAQTLLIAHNVDIATRIPSPQVGIRLRFFGEYEWDSEGGAIHWTHKDPAKVHVDGWLEYEGIRYQ